MISPKLSLQKQLEHKLNVKKSILKRDYYLANKENIVMKDNLSYMTASPINRFFNSKEYRVWKNDFGDDLLMKKTDDLDAVEASSIVNEYGPKLVELVIILENHWFFMTSFSAVSFTTTTRSMTVPTCQR